MNAMQRALEPVTQTVTPVKMFSLEKQEGKHETGEEGFFGRISGYRRMVNLPDIQII